MAEQEKFIEECREARKFAFSLKDPLLVHHYDADGISSGSVVLGSFLKQGRKIRVECIKKLDDAAIERYSKEKELIFTDLGGGNKRVNELKDVLIIDHHETEGIEKLQINPVLYDIDGGTELSAAGTAYFVFEEYVELGVVGGVGDMQSPFHGMNTELVKRGVKAGRVKIEKDLSFYGRYSRPVVQFLAYSDDPYIPTISYNEQKSQKLLSDLGIELFRQKGSFKVPRRYADLTEDEKRKLVSALVRILVDFNKIKSAKELFGESYVFPERANECYEANEFSTMLNACGRHGKPEIGRALCLEEQGSLEKAAALLSLHRRSLREGISFGRNNVQNLGKFYFLDGRGVISENIIGTVAGMLLFQNWKKPIIAVALGDESTIKFSSRAPKPLVRKGLDLGAMMRNASEENNGVGGGHNIAAGASVKSEKLNGFLLSLGRYLD